MEAIQEAVFTIFDPRRLQPVIQIFQCLTFQSPKMIFEAFDTLSSGILFGAQFFVSSPQFDFVYNLRLL